MMSASGTAIHLAETSLWLMDSCPVVQSSETSKQMALLSPKLWHFLQAAYSAAPEIFSVVLDDDLEKKDLFAEINAVMLAWGKLVAMRKSREKWTEADMVAQVYNVLRGPAVRDSAFRYVLASIYVDCHTSSP